MSANVPEKQSIISHYIAMVRECWRYAGQVGGQRRMVLFYGLFVLGNIATMMQPQVVGNLINALQTGGPDVLRRVGWWLGAYVGVVSTFWLFHGPARVIERNLAIRIRQQFYADMYHKLTHLPMRWHNEYHSGNTANRLNKAATALSEFAGRQFLFLETWLRYVLLLILMAFISWPVALGLFVFSLFVFALLFRFDAPIIRLINTANEKHHTFAARLFDYLTNMNSIIAFSRRGISAQDLHDLQTGIFQEERKEILLNEMKWFAWMFLSALMYFCVLFGYIGWHLQQGQTLMIGSVVAIFQYLLRLDQVFMRVAELFGLLVKFHTDYASVAPITQAYNDMGLEDDALSPLRVAGGAIAFEQIGFKYPGGKQVFDGFNLNIKAGEKVGLVGASGVGKSTLVQLLLRFYDAQSGVVRIDGQDTRAVSSETLRAHIGMMPQDTSLFETTLYENILVGRPDASREDVIAAARRAHADDFIRGLSDGYETLVGERGVKLSGGQRQRVAIARAILKNAPILILDEATSALDSESEKYIQESLAELMEGKTVIAIAHRLSTIARLDRLIVLDAGQVVEDGPHDALIAREGLYAKLWGMQSGGFLPED